MPRSVLRVLDPRPARTRLIFSPQCGTILPPLRKAYLMARARIRLLVVLALATMAFAAPASADAASVKVNATLAGTITDGSGWCCGSTFEFEGSAVLPRIGAVTFTGGWVRGCEGLADPTAVCFRSLSLALVARSGDELFLSGHNEWVFPLEPPPQQLTWSITGGTGRFADFSGSGTYTVGEAGSTLVISLDGTLQF